MDNDQVADIIISILRYRYNHTTIRNTDDQRNRIAEFLRTGRINNLAMYRKHYLLINKLAKEVMNILQDESAIPNLSEEKQST